MTLTATPDIGSTFEGWSGVCTGTGSCTVTMSDTISVTATFNITLVSGGAILPTVEKFTLTVTVEGSGTVTSDPAGIFCVTGPCITSVDLGTEVILTATPDSGSTFESWGGACSGTGTCTVTLTANRAVTATFDLIPDFTLTVTVSGSGTVSSGLAGILCVTGPCTTSVDPGTEVILTATPDSGSTFAGWGGACQGLGQCNITMDADRSLTAIFAQATQEKVTKVVLKGAINVKQDSLGFVRYLGEVLNEGPLSACFVEITVDSDDASGALINTDFTYVNGSSLLISGIMTDTCLHPGETGSFEIGTSMEVIPASYSAIVNWDTNDITTPPVTSSQVVLDGPLTEATDFWGNKELLGYIKNLHPSLTLKFVSISFTALSGSTVIDTDFTYINGSTCVFLSTLTTDTCLHPDQSGSFSLSFSEPPSAITDFYYKINYGIND